jgi:polar amino acid transport system substrate-binding protein
VFYLQEDQPDIVDYADLAGRRVAVLRGAKYFDRFDSDEDLEKVKLADYATAIRVVEGGRVDALIMPELQGDYLLKEHGQSLRKSTYNVPGRPSYIAVSKRSPLQESRESLLRALRSMDEDGTTAAIISRYR